MTQRLVHTVFVAGWMRSGTTLCAQALGAARGCVAIGELKSTWSALARNLPCSCGLDSRECPLWKAVCAAVFGREPSNDDLWELDRQAQELERTANLPMLIRARRNLRDHWPSELRSYVETLERTIRTVADSTGADTVVDSSKSAPALAMRRLMNCGDLRVVHIVRDLRGVANSERRGTSSKVVLVENPPPNRNGLMSALLWIATNVLCAVIGRQADRYMRVSYEELMMYGPASLARMVRAAGLEPVADSESKGELSVGHIAAGNPSRLLSPQTGLRPDLRWHTELSVPRKIALGFIQYLFRWLARGTVRLSGADNLADPETQSR